MIKMVLVYDVMMEGLSDLYPILLTNYHISFENDMLGAWYVITGINPEAILMVGDHSDHPLCPGLKPGPPSQTPGGLGQRYWSVSFAPGANELIPVVQLKRRYRPMSATAMIMWMALVLVQMNLE